LSPAGDLDAADAQLHGVLERLGDDVGLVAAQHPSEDAGEQVEQ
jgi:hypothetical protein